MRRKIEEKLLYLGITPNLKGFSYICDAAEYILTKKNYNMSDVYSYVSSMHEDDYACYHNVEGNIRHAIKKVDRFLWAALGGRGTRNFEFLCTLAFIVKKEAEENES